MNAARLYGDRPGLVARLSRNALFTLSMPSLPASARLEIERLEAGERVAAGQILRRSSGRAEADRRLAADQPTFDGAGNRP
jgi:hypothetical protein